MTKKNNYYDYVIMEIKHNTKLTHLMLIAITKYPNYFIYNTHTFPQQVSACL